MRYVSSRNLCSLTHICYDLERGREIGNSGDISDDDVGTNDKCEKER